MAKQKAGKGLQAPKTPSSALAEIVGKKAIPRGQIVKKMWEYIKENDLQESRNITCDETLLEVFGVPVEDAEQGKMSAKEYKALCAKIKKAKKMTMFEMNKILGYHLS